MNRKEKRLVKKYEWWIVGLLIGKIPSNNYARKSFLHFHRSSRNPKTKLQRAWLAFRNAHKGQTLGDVFYNKARALNILSNQNKNISQDEVIRAFQLAEFTGSNDARQWLKESTLSNCTRNSIWNRSILNTYDVNNYKPN